jgi:hypothetical protein
MGGLDRQLYIDSINIVLVLGSKHPGNNIIHLGAIVVLA